MEAGMASHHAAADTGGSAARFSILGPLDVRSDDGALVPVSPPQNRQLLATLLLFAGAPCSSRFLARAIWDERPPGNPGHSLRTAIWGLRRSLGASGRRLESSGGGRRYQFTAEPGEVDTGLFYDRARQGYRAWYRDEVTLAARLLGEAAGLWRDPALADVPDTPALADARDTLVRARLDVEELRVDTRLALGGHREAVGELRRILDGDPLREHAWAQLIVALYRSGRTADALQAFCDAQAALRAEYGCDPGPELTEIRREVAAGSRDLLAGNAGVSSYPAFGTAAGPGAGAARAL
jgi:DNA-binding SARP family transcriptional activator